MSDARAKPRFAPKQKASTGDSGDAIAASQEPAKAEVAPPRRDAAHASGGSRVDGRGRERGRGFGEGGRGSAGGGRSGGGRGRGSYMFNPSGKAFFSGDSGTLQHTKGHSTAIKVDSSKGRGLGGPEVKIKQELGIKGATRADQSVVADKDVISTETIEIHDTGDVYVWAPEIEMDPELGGRRRMLGRGKAGKMEAGGFQYNIPAEDASSDSDNDNEDNVNSREEPTGLRAAAFNEAAPCALSDRSALSLSEAHDAPLLTKSQDAEVLAREKDENIFLLQMPSGFALPKRDERHGGVELDPDVTLVSSSTGDKARCGKVGKLQLMASGRLFIVLDNGTRFEVHRGLATSFSQHLCAIYVDGSQSETKPSADTAGAGGAKGRGLKAAIEATQGNGDVYEEGPTHGELYTMGPITAKWTVTPEHDIGEHSQLNSARPVAKAPVIKSENEEALGADVHELYE